MSTESFWVVAIIVAFSVVVVLATSILLYYFFKYWEYDNRRIYLDLYHRAKGKEAAPAEPAAAGGEDGAAEAAGPDVDKAAGREDEVAPMDRDTSSVTIGLCVERIDGAKEGTVGYAVRIDLGELLRLVRLEFGTMGFGFWERSTRTMGPVAMAGMVRRIMDEYYKQKAAANGAADATGPERE